MSAIGANVSLSAWLADDVTFTTRTHPDGFCHFVNLETNMLQRFSMALSPAQVTALRDACDALLDSITPAGTSEPDPARQVTA